ncbi:alpha/beta hydrolase [Kitasatospora sp. RB6PN24]|uniref:alpha/beta hydrolase n=1 Tax=Kitasatospora humi TaxID=2893891 RepID=UPI001E2EC0B0|nr:alpha/beta hydrolase [Kitasatospora humi]MCC9310099.1 alpha/beta hydrolase [Kitasatospora humi]
MSEIFWVFCGTLGTLAVLYLLFLLLAWVGHDSSAFAGAGRVIEAPPAAFARTDLQLPIDGDSRDAEPGTVHAWWIADVPGAHSTLLFFHGNGYPLEQAAAVEAPTLRSTGANLLLMDYRGYGTSSPVKPSAATTAADARAGLRHLTKDRGIPLSQIWICGRSLGSAVALRLASEFPGCAGLILISPITNTVDVKPFGPLLRPLRWLGLAKGFDSRKRITGLDIPLLIITGTNDAVGTPAMAAELHGRASGRKRLELIDGADHSIWKLGGEHIPTIMAEMMGTPTVAKPANSDAAPPGGPLSGSS